MMIESCGAVKGGNLLSFKDEFKSENAQWEELGSILCLSDRIELVKESDWWLEYCFSRLFEALTKLGNWLTLGCLFQDQDQVKLKKLKKDDDFRPSVPMSEVDQFFGLEKPSKTWDYRNCDLYLYRRIQKKGNHTSGPEVFNAWMSDFQTRASDQFDKLKSPKYKDMQLTVGNYTFLADSYMLRSQSIKFYRYFFQTSEEATSTLEIKDMTPTELEAFLVYIYCRTWPTYVMEIDMDGRRRPSKRFLEILKNYGVSLSIDKDHVPVLTTKLEWRGIGTIWGRDEFIVDTFLDELFSPRNEKYAIEEKADYGSILELSSNNRFYESLNEKSNSSRWNFDFGDRFVFNNPSNLSNPIEQNEDWRVKQEQGRKLLVEDLDFYSVTNHSKLFTTSEWLVTQHRVG